MIEEKLLQTLNEQLQVELPKIISEKELEDKLSTLIDHLIQHDFQKLVYILYKVDVSEVKLKQMLQQNADENAYIIIAKLIIERQKQKIESRKKFTPANNISEKEKW